MGERIGVSRDLLITTQDMSQVSDPTAVRHRGLDREMAAHLVALVRAGVAELHGGWRIPLERLARHRCRGLSPAPQLQPDVEPHPSQTKHDPAGRILVPQVKHIGASEARP
jgi:hypothetical protein